MLRALHRNMKLLGDRYERLHRFDDLLMNQRLKLGKLRFGVTYGN